MSHLSLVPSRPANAFVFEAHQRINRKNSEHTRIAYRRDLTGWLAFCNYQQCNPQTASIDVAALYRDHLHASVAVGTVRRALSALSWLYGLLLSDRIVRQNPFHPGLLAWPPAGKVSKTPAVEDAIALAMIANAKADASILGSRDAVILTMLYETGLRRESIATLLRKGYRPPQLAVTVKGGEEVVIELPADSRQLLDAWLRRNPSTGYVFPNRHGGHINVSMINKLVRARGAAVGHPEIHPHCFRAAWITAAYDAELPEYEIQAGAHHKSLMTTRRYDRRARGISAAGQVAAFRGKGV